jgi:carbon monoxide dehydrogenase subunit G
MIYKSETWVDAPPAVAWQTLIDLERAPEHVPYLERLQLRDGRDVAAGQRLHMAFDYLGHRFDTDAIVLRLDPEHELALRGERPSLGVVVNAQWLLAEESGGTRVQMTVSLTFHTLLAQLGARALIGDRVAEEALKTSLASFKAQVESEASS